MVPEQRHLLLQRPTRVDHPEEPSLARVGDRRIGGELAAGGHARRARVPRSAGRCRRGPARRTRAGRRQPDSRSGPVPRPRPDCRRIRHGGGGARSCRRVSPCVHVPTRANCVPERTNLIRSEFACCHSSTTSETVGSRRPGRLDDRQNCQSRAPRERRPYLSQGEQVRRKGIRPIGAGRELAPQVQADVDPPALADFRLHERPALRARVVGERVGHLHEVDVALVGGLRAEEVQPPLLHPPAPGRLADHVGGGEHGMRRHEHRHRRVLVGHAIGREPPERTRGRGRSPDGAGIRPVLRLVELELVVLDDHGAALRGVVEQALVVGSQVTAALVRPHARHHHGVFRQVGRRQLLRCQELHGRAELHEGRRHLIAHAHDVAHRHARDGLQVEHLQAARRIGHQVPTPDVRVLDRLVALVERLPVARRDGPDVVAPGPCPRGGRDRETHLTRLVFTGEGHGLGRGRGRHPAGSCSDTAALPPVLA